MIGGKLLSASAAVQPTFIEDVFSTYLYTGNGSTQTITNGIDLAGEGGLVWIKGRSGATDHQLFDTLRGATKELISNSTAAETTDTDTLTAFNANGFSLGADATTNTNAATYASWTFRQAPRFFDVVTYTGNATNRTIAHDLGVVPGCIIIKRIVGGAGDWYVYHRGNTAAPETDYLVLNSTAATVDDDYWNDTQPTSSVFSLNNKAAVNASGSTYVAYLFAHDPLGPSGDGSDGLIACGSYTGNGSTTGPVIDLGWEPQWLIIKRADTNTQNWFMTDIMRGMPTGVVGDATILANTNGAESVSAIDNHVDVTATGFTLKSTSAGFNASANTYIYIAIRRGPMREPTVGTEVFGVTSYTGNNTAGRLITGGMSYPVDAAFINSGGGGSRMASRLTGTPFLVRNDTGAQIVDTTRFEDFDSNTGFYIGSNSQVNSSSFTYNASMFSRAPGFFDVVAYTGTGTAQTVNHNLGVAPEMMIVKKRSAADNWVVYAGDATDYLILNSTAATADLNTMWNDTAPTSSVFSLGTNDDVNGSAATFIAYLFSTLPGISKVGSYTGNGTSQTINCGFTTGARYVLIKRTNTTGEWLEWNTAYGIVSGTETAWRVNAGGDIGTAYDIIDPNSSGFIVNQDVDNNMNVNAATYIYLAIA